MQIGVILAPQLGRAAQIARLAEGLGFATILFPDSQNLAPEVWGQLMLAASGTSTIQLGTGVTNPVTRDPAVTASAALALQVESGGRAIVGIGRGDSAVQRIGRPAARVAELERYLVTLQTYLSGGTVDRDGFASRLEWHAFQNLPKVPVEIAATGPKVIEVAARRADRIAFAVGADPDHLGSALERARAAARAAGRDPGELRFGAFINCVVHDDPTVAREAVRGTTATFARFSSMAGSDLTRLPPPLRKAAEHLRAKYDMRVHTRAGAEHARALDDAFLDWYSIAGRLDTVLPRFKRLADLGLDFCHVVPGSPDTPRDLVAASLQMVAKEIAPAVA